MAAGQPGGHIHRPRVGGAGQALVVLGPCLGPGQPPDRLLRGEDLAVLQHHAHAAVDNEAAVRTVRAGRHQLGISPRLAGDALNKGGKGLPHSAIGTVIGQHIKGIGLQRLQKGGIRRGVHRTVRAAGQRYARGCRQRIPGKRDPAVGGQLRRFLHPLAVHHQTVHQGGDCICSGLVHILRRRDGDIVATDAGIQGGSCDAALGEGCAGLGGPLRLKAVEQQSGGAPGHIGALEGLPHEQRLRRREAVADEGRRVPSGFNGHHLPHRAPGQSAAGGQGPTAALGHNAAAPALEIDVYSGPDLVLRGPVSSGHYDSPLLKNLSRRAFASWTV